MGARRRSNQKQQRQSNKTDKDTAVEDAPKQATQKAARAQNETPKIVAQFDEVLAAIESMYADQLKPFGRILRKRVAELAVAAPGVKYWKEESLADVDIKQLLATCEESECLQVEPEEGGDWSVLIIGRPQTFVDVYSPADLYPEGMWGAAAAYFQLVSGDDMYLPGGRYSCAQELQSRNLAFLRDRSLGQICHIVQLAISQKKLLGYLNGAVVPYAYSQSMLKEQCAQRNAACTVALTDSGVPENVAQAATADNGLTMADWDTARQYLRDILNNAAKINSESVGEVPLSNVNRLFRSKFQMELSETRLGHSKLSELLQDERFGDICTVQLQGHGYIVVQVDAQPEEEKERGLLRKEPVNTPAAKAPSNAICLSEALALQGGGMEMRSPFVNATHWPPMDYCFGSLVQRTFIHASLPPPSPAPNARKRSTSVPKEVGSGKHIWDSEKGCGTFPGEQTEDTESTVDSRNGSAPDSARDVETSRNASTIASENPVKVLLQECSLGATMEAGVADLSDAAGDAEPHPRRLQFCPDEPLALDEAFLFLENAPVTYTPMDMYTPPALVKLPSLSHALFGDAGSGTTTAERVDHEACRRLQFCVDEPLALEEAGVYIDLPDMPLTLEHTPTCRHRVSSGSTWSSLSPASIVKGGHVGSIALSRVQNTFIHSPLPPPTPLRVGASRRSRSLPKNVGSDKNAWEATCQALGCSHLPDARQDGTFKSGDCLPTPSVYGDYNAASIFANFSSEPLYVPPSPALTASPTYRCTAQNFGSGAKSLPLTCVGAPQRSVEDFAWAQQADANEHVRPSCSDAAPPSIISLASLLA
jgi:hypothetical protein